MNTKNKKPLEVGKTYTATIYIDTDDTNDTNDNNTTSFTSDFFATVYKFYKGVK